MHLRGNLSLFAVLSLTTLLLFTATLWAQNPANGSISPTIATPVQWTGTMTGTPPTGEGTLSCTDGTN